MKHVVMHCIYSLEHGGAQQVVVDLVKHLDQDRFQPKVCSITGIAPRQEELEALGVETFVLGKRAHSTVSGVSSMIRLAGLFRRQGVAVLHTHGFAGNVWSRLAGILARVPVLVHTDHNVEVKRRRVLLLERFLLASTDMVTGISEDATRNFLRNTGASHEKVRTIRNGFDFARIEKAADLPLPSDLPLRPGRKTVVLIGRLVEIKGHRYLLEAAAQIVSQRDDVQFLLVGDGPLRGFLEQFVHDRGLQEHVLFAGIRKDVPVLLRHAEVFVLASLTEGLPITLLEAMASEVPVVVTGVGGIPEVVEDNVTGLVVPPADVTALRQAILNTLEQPDEARRRSRVGLQRLRDEFAIVQMVDAYQDLYRGLLADKGLL